MLLALRLNRGGFVLTVPVTCIAAAAIAFLITYLMVPVSMKIATKVGAIDMPSERRVHTSPTTRMGGIALFSGIVLTSALLLSMGVRIGAVPSEFAIGKATSANPLALLLGFCFMFAMGAADDILQLRARTKFVGQIVAASIVVASGIVIHGIHITGLQMYIDFGFMAYPITVIYLVSFANVINLIDGLDGLAAGVTCIAATAFAILAAAGGVYSVLIMAIAVAASCLAFLHFNFHPAKLFMGDCGSLSLGFALGIVSLSGAMRYAGLASIVVPVVIAAVPVIDTFAAIVRRKIKGVPISLPDKNHIHHVLLQNGFSQRHVVFDIYLMCIVFAGTGIAIYRAPTSVSVIVLIADILFAAFLIWKLGLFGKIMGRYYPEGRLSLRKKKREKQEAALDAIREERGLIEKIDLNVTRILFVSQHYWPEPFATTDICEELVRRGYSVTVLTGQPNYPEGKLYSGYENARITEEVHHGVRIMRCKLRPRKTGAINRVLNYYSFKRSGNALARLSGEGFDVVYSYQTSPVMMACPALEVAKKYKTPVLLHVVDIWPECLTAGGITAGRAIYNHYLQVSRNIYSAADKLAVTSKRFTEYLCNTVGVNAEDALYLPQYAEDIFNEAVPSACNITLSDFPDSAINVMFAGNVGAAQSVQTAIRAAAQLKGEGFVFHIVGSGSELDNCKKLAQELQANNVVFHGRHPLEEMPAYYAKADAMLATFADSPILGYTLPRKIQSYMAAGKPVLGTILGAAKEVVEDARCGLCCNAEDARGLVDICREFAALSADERRKMGENGMNYCHEHFSKDAYFDKLCAELDALKGTKHGC